MKLMNVAEEEMYRCVASWISDRFNWENMIIHAYKGPDRGVLSIIREEIEIHEYPNTPPHEHDQGTNDTNAERTIQ